MGGDKRRARGLKRRYPTPSGYGERRARAEARRAPPPFVLTVRERRDRMVDGTVFVLWLLAFALFGAILWSRG